jgi:hypothetical protein
MEKSLTHTYHIGGIKIQFIKKMFKTDLLFNQVRYSWQRHWRRSVQI